MQTIVIVQLSDTTWRVTVIDQGGQESYVACGQNTAQQALLRALRDRPGMFECPADNS